MSASLSINAELSALETVGEFVETGARLAGLDTAATYKLRLSVDEIVTNIITHGYSDNYQLGQIQLSTNNVGQFFQIKIVDKAPAFDPLQLTTPDLNLPFDKRPLGGLGIFLALSGVDYFQYVYQDGCNCNILTVEKSAAKVGTAATI